MYNQEVVRSLKSDIKRNIKTWASSKIADLCTNRQNLKTISVYLERGLNNWLDREDARIDSIIDNIFLFIADENGKIDTDVIMDDLISIFKGMEVKQTMIGLFPVEYGAGEITISIPHNPMLDFVFGNLGCVRISVDDILEIKELFTKTPQE